MVDRQYQVLFGCTNNYSIAKGDGSENSLHLQERMSYATLKSKTAIIFEQTHLEMDLGAILSSAKADKRPLKGPLAPSPGKLRQYGLRRVGR